MSNILEFKQGPYKTPPSVIDTFWHLVREDEPERLTAWLEDHPRDRSTLLQLYRERQNVEAQG